MTSLIDIYHRYNYACLDQWFISAKYRIISPFINIKLFYLWYEVKRFIENFENERFIKNFENEKFFKFFKMKDVF